VNSYQPGAIPNILNLIIPFLELFKIKMISLEKMDNLSGLEKLPSFVHFMSLGKHRLNVIGTLIALRKEIQNFNPDIIHSHLGRGDIYSAICKTTNAKLVSTVHTIKKFRINRGLFNITQTVSSFLDFRVNYKVFISEIVKNSWINKDCTYDYDIIYNPVRIQKKPTKKIEKRKSFNILFAGRLLDFKNPILIVKSMRELMKIDSDINLVIAGVGPQFDKIKKYIITNSLEKNISLIGFCEKMEDIYTFSDVIVFPSLWSSGLPMVAVEASQFNNALITSDIFGIEEFIQDDENGLLFKSNRCKNRY